MLSSLLVLLLTEGILLVTAVSLLLSQSLSPILLNNIANAKRMVDVAN